MGATTVGKIIREVCTLLWEILQPFHMAHPSAADFRRIAEQYMTIWNFPNCIGAIDGKHVRIKCPPHSGSMYFNYKHFFSIVLQGVADDHYRFTCIDVGGYGKQSDSGTFKASSLGVLLDANKLDLPCSTNLPNSTVIAPHVFIADEAYPLTENIMRPFPKQSLGESQELFNIRLSRARKTIECAFGILFAKWRIFSGTIETHPDTVDVIIQAACILHNTIIDKEGYCSDFPEGPSIPEGNLHNLKPSRSHNPSSKKAKEIRNKFMMYFVNSKSSG